MWRKCKIILNKIDCRMSPPNLAYLKQFCLFYGGDRSLQQIVVKIDNTRGHKVLPHPVAKVLRCCFMYICYLHRRAIGYNKR